MKYASKRDWWLVLILWGAAVLIWASVLPASREAESTLEAVGMLLVAAAVSGFVLWVLYGTGYDFEDDRLVIRSGPVRRSVPLASVTGVAPSRNPLSSPACSLDRLKITYGNRWVLISPEDKAEFLAELKRRAPNL